MGKEPGQGHENRPVHWGIRVFSWTGILMAAFGAYMLLHSAWVVMQGEHAEGRVVAAVEGRLTDRQLREERERGVTDRDRLDNYEVEFVAADQRSYRIQVPGVRGAGFEVGEIVTVVYPRADPAAGFVSAWTQLWLPGLLVTFMGAVFWLVAMFVSVMLS